MWGIHFTATPAKSDKWIIDWMLKQIFKERASDYSMEDYMLHPPTLAERSAPTGTGKLAVGFMWDDKSYISTPDKLVFILQI